MKRAEQYKFTQDLMPSLDMCQCLCVFYSFNCETLTVCMQDMAVIYRLQSWQPSRSTSDLLLLLLLSHLSNEFQRCLNAGNIIARLQWCVLQMFCTWRCELEDYYCRWLKKWLEGFRFHQRGSGFVRELRCCGSILELAMFFIPNVDGWKNSVLISMMITI